jgi:hypothetical protein
MGSNPACRYVYAALPDGSHDAQFLADFLEYDC